MLHLTALSAPLGDSNEKRNILWIVPIIISMIFGFTAPSIASDMEHDDSDILYSDYRKFVADGVIGEDVSFEDWKTLVKSSRELEDYLSNSNDFDLIYSSENNVARASFTLQKGDVVITNGTSSAGILGHAGIANSSNLVLHIGGPGQRVSTITLLTWHNKYTNAGDDSWTKIYRHSERQYRSPESCEWGYKDIFKLRCRV